MQGHELLDFIEQGPFPEAICKYYFKQMLEGLNYIHERGFSHRQLAPNNIMIDAATNDIKIVGFGFSCTAEGRPTRLEGCGPGYNRTCKGDPGYMAPEIWE